MTAKNKQNAEIFRTHGSRSDGATMRMKRMRRRRMMRLRMRWTGM